MSEWISVKDRLPTFDKPSPSVRHQRVLVWLADAHWLGPYMGRAYSDGEIRPEGFSGQWNVTHWMPLPEPPK